MTELKFQRADIRRLTGAYRDALQESEAEYALSLYGDLQRAWRDLQDIERCRVHAIRPGGPALEQFLSADIDALRKEYMGRLIQADIKTLEDLSALPKPPNMDNSSHPHVCSPRGDKKPMADNGADNGNGEQREPPR